MRGKHGSARGGGHGPRGDRSERRGDARGQPRRGKPQPGKPQPGKPQPGKPQPGKAQRDAKHGDARRGDARRGTGPRRDDSRHNPRHAASRDDASGGAGRGRNPRDPHAAAQTLATSDFSQQLRSAGDLMQRKEPPAVGEWLWTMRQGAERDLVEELLLGKDLKPRGFLPALAISARAPRSEGERLEVTFARQGFAISALAHGTALNALADALLPKLIEAVGSAPEHALHVFVPDSDAGNRLAARAQTLETLLAERLQTALPGSKRIEDLGPRHASIPLLQACMFDHEAVAFGVIASDRALSPYSGGRARMRLSSDSPSRAARKLEEAFAWIGVSPGASELCVDLGAAPGGWSYVLLARKARVIAVDPARMDPALAQDRRLRHIQGDAFKFMPDEPADWLFCDMVWRPMEVAQMLGRWARKRQTRMLVANFKLPMKRKVEQVDTLKRTLAAAGFTAIRTRQLYHDRDEITLCARVR